MLELPLPITLATAEPTSVVIPTPAKHLPPTLPDLPRTIELPQLLQAVILPTTAAPQDLRTTTITTILQDLRAATTAPTAVQQDLRATAITLTTAEATPDPLTTHPTTQIAQIVEVTATHTPDRQTIVPAAIPTTPDRQTALLEVIQDPPTVLPAAQVAEAATAAHTPDPLVAQVAIQDLPVVQAAFQEAVVLQEAPSPAEVQEAMLQEDKFRIQNPYAKASHFEVLFFISLQFENNICHGRIIHHNIRLWQCQTDIETPHLFTDCQ